MTRSATGTNRFRIWSTFGLMGISVLGLQYVTLPKLQELVVSASGASRLEGVRSRAVTLVLQSLTSVLNPVDLCFALLLTGTVAGLVVAEMRHGTVSRFVFGLETRSTELMLFLFFCSFLATRYYLNTGDIFMSDAESLGVRAWMVSEHLRHWQWPVWSNYWYMGFPLNHYYGPLYFALVGALNLAVGNIHLATKLILWASHIGSIFAMFFFLRAATRSLYGALVGALAYGIVFYRIAMILYAGDMNLNIVWFLYPLLFLATEMHLSGRMAVRPNLLFFGAVTGSLILTHHAHAFFGLFFWGVYISARLFTWDAAGSAKVRALRFLGLGAIFGLCIGAFSLLPFVLEYGDVRGMPNIPFNRLLPSIRSAHWLSMMVQWTPMPSHSSTEAYVGATLIALSVLSAWLALRTRSSVGLSLLVCALYSFSTVRSGTQYGLKNMNFVIFFISALTAFAPIALRLLLDGTSALDRLKRKWGECLDARLAVLVIGLIVLDLGPLTFQYTFIKNFYESNAGGYTQVLDTNPNYRVLERRVVQFDPSKSLASNFEPDRIGIVSPYLPIQSPLGRMNEESAKSISYSAEMIKRVQLDLNQEHLSDLSLKGLLLMNVRFLVFRDRSHFFAPPLKPGAAYSINGLTLELTHTRPLLVSTRAIRVEDVGGYDSNNVIERREYWDRDMLDYRQDRYDTIIRPLIDKMNINLDRGTADYLVLRDDRALPTLQGNPHDVTVDIHAFDVTIDAVRIRYKSSANAYARLPFSYFPYLDVQLDGTETPFLRSAMHCLVIALPAGEHVISIRGRASPLQKGTFFFSLMATALIVSWPSRSLERLVRGRAPR